MSFLVKNYKEVSRVYFNRLFSNKNNLEIHDDLDFHVINTELEYSGFNSFNKHVIWWRIHYNHYNRILKIEPIYDNYD